MVGEFAVKKLRGFPDGFSMSSAYLSLASISLLGILLYYGLTLYTRPTVSRCL
jgi:hypothetical protein